MPSHQALNFVTRGEKNVWYSLVSGDLRVAVGTHLNGNFIAHWRISGLFVRALRTHGSTTFSTVMLREGEREKEREREREWKRRRMTKRVNESQLILYVYRHMYMYMYVCVYVCLSQSYGDKQYTCQTPMGLLWPHFLDIPEEGYTTLLAGVSASHSAVSSLCTSTSHTPTCPSSPLESSFLVCRE